MAKAYNNNTIVFFDFDGTITFKDSMLDFIQFAVGHRHYYAGLLQLLPTLLAFTLKILPAHLAKERMISFYFKGWSAKRFQAISDHYSRTRIDMIVRANARKKIQWHLSKKHKVVVVSASIQSWLQPWCEINQLKLIATQMEIVDGYLTGMFATNNCNGIEKANRIQSQYDLSSFDYIYAYGNSSGDKAMLSLADKPFYRCYE